MKSLIQNLFNKQHKTPSSESTVKRCCLVVVPKGQVVVSKSVLRRGDKAIFTVDDWKNVLFTDESKLEVYGRYNRMYVRRQQDRNSKT